MICITKYDIPDYLKESELYENIDSYESFNIPCEYYKENIIIESFDDLTKSFNVHLTNRNARSAKSECLGDTPRHTNAFTARRPGITQR